MKKIMVLIAVAIMATCSQAASFKWAASGVTDGANPISGSATLYALIEGSWTSVSSATMSSGTIAAANTLFASDDLVANTTYQFYYTVENDKGTFTSVTKTSRAQANSTPTLNFGSAGTWVAVPEPTSGLLMLVGLAGLALRRRQA